MKKEQEVFRRGYRITESGELLSPKGEVLKGTKNTTGYKRMSYKSKGKQIFVDFHRLQAFQKYGNKLFEEGIEVRHLNGNRLDNSFKNIALGTHSDNMMDIPEQIRIDKALHATSFIRKYDKNEVRNYYKKVKSYKKTMEHFNISSKGTLHFILNK